MTPSIECGHPFLRAQNGGLCPVCYAELAKFKIDPKDLWQQILVEKQERQAQACKSSLATFFRQSWDVLEPSTPLIESWHFDVLGAHLEAVFRNWQRRKKTQDGRDNTLQNFLANLPPGTAKSRFFSVCFIAWVWTQDPTLSVIAISGNPTVAVRDADLTRTLINSEWYRQSFKPRWTLRGDRHAVGYYQLEATNGSTLGWRRSFGVESAVIGERADCLLMDDLHDPRDIEPHTLARQIDAIDKGFYNRVNNPSVSVRISIMHRVHTLDATAHFLAKRAQKWLHLVIPLTRQEAQTANELGWRDPRQVGQRLMPTVYTDSVLEVERDRLMELHEALYEQAPREHAGAVFKAAEFRWFRFDEDLPRNLLERPSGSNRDEAQILKKQHDGRYFDYAVIVVDSNAAQDSAHARGSHVGIQVWGLLGQNRFLVDDRTAALGFNETLDEIKSALAAWPEVTKVWVEKKALGPALLAQLEQHVAELQGVEADKSKIARAKAASVVVRAGRVWLREGQPWNGKTCEQLYTYPYTPDRRNDRVDCTAHLLNHAVQRDFLSRFEALAAL